MFPLNTESFPATAAELTEALSESLERVFMLPAQPVAMRANAYPEIEELTITLDGAQLRADAQRPSLALGDTTPAVRVAKFMMSGRGVSVAGVSADVSVNAAGVRLNSGKAKNGTIVLAVQTAVTGRVQVSTTKAALEDLIAQVAKAEAGKHGVSVDGVKLKLESQSPRAVAAEVQLRARKLFLSASIRVRAQLELDEQLNATISGLRCEGDGAMASVACGVLAPHLEKLDGRVFSLMALPLGEMQLRDVQLAVGENLAVTAGFGAA